MLTYQDMLAHVPSAQETPDWAWFLHAIPALNLLEATPQDSYYHAEGNVWIHTRMVVEALMRGGDYAAASQEQRFILFYAALLHDIAKPATTVVDPISGKIGQPGHSKRGAIDVRILCWYAGVPFEMREQLCRIIAVHQLPFFAFAGKRSDQPAEFLVRKLSHELDLRLLAAVAQADMEGRSYEHKANCLVDIELFRELARDEQCYDAPKRFADQHTRLAYFRGAGIAADFPHHQNAGSQVTVMSGLPASGKNHWVAQHRVGLAVVSVDDARQELGLRHGDNEGAAAHRAMDKARARSRATRRSTCCSPTTPRLSWSILSNRRLSSSSATPGATPACPTRPSNGCYSSGKCPCRPKPTPCITRWPESKPTNRVRVK